jgi:hypothetical protein
VIISSDSGIAERLYKELAETSDEGIDLDGWTQELDEIAAADSLPPYCTLTWHDGELTVMPYIDDELPRFGDHPERPTDGVYEYLHVNDHGNADLMIWDHNRQSFECAWSVV